MSDGQLIEGTTMNEGQEQDYDYLIRNGATWSQAMDWCNAHLLGRSNLLDLRGWLTRNNVGT
jgi:hypothetical protein